MNQYPQNGSYGNVWNGQQTYTNNAQQPYPYNVQQAGPYQGQQQYPAYNGQQNMGGAHPIPVPYSNGQAQKVTANSGYIPVQAPRNPQLQQYQEPAAEETTTLTAYIRKRNVLPLVATIFSLLYALYLLVWLLVWLLSRGAMGGVIGPALEAAMMKGILMPHIIVSLLASAAVVYAYHSDYLWAWLLAAVLHGAAILLLLNQVWGLFIPAILCIGLFIQGLFSGRKTE